MDDKCNQLIPQVKNTSRLSATPARAAQSALEARKDEKGNIPDFVKSGMLAHCTAGHSEGETLRGTTGGQAQRDREYPGQLFVFQGLETQPAGFSKDWKRAT